MKAAENWTAVPGLIELVERQVDPSGLGPDELVVPAAMRSGLLGDRDLLDQLVTWLKGYRRDRLVCEREPVWVPLAQLWPAPEGKAAFKYVNAQSDDGNAKLTIFADKGFGGASQFTFSRSIEISTDGMGRQYGVLVYLTIWRYVHRNDGDDSFDRVDVDCDGAAFDVKIDDVPADNFPTGKRILALEELEALGFEVRSRYRASGSTSPGLDSYGESSTAEHQWGFELKLPGLDLIQSSLELSARSSRSESFEVTFELPRGHDYVFFQRGGEYPLVPFCARLVAGSS